MSPTPPRPLSRPSRRRLRALARLLDARLDDRPSAALLQRRVLARLSEWIEDARGDTPEAARALELAPAFLVDTARAGPRQRREVLTLLVALARTPDAARARAASVAILELTAPRELHELNLRKALRAHFFSLLRHNPASALRRDAYRFIVDAHRLRGAKLESSALTQAARALGRGVIPLARHGLEHPDPEVQRAALEALIDLRAPVDMTVVRRFAAGPEGVGPEPLARCLLDARACELTPRILAHAIVRHAGPVPTVLRLAALGVDTDPPLPPEFTPRRARAGEFDSDVQCIAAALWRRDPRDWRPPSALLDHPERCARKLGRQLVQAHRDHVRRRLLRLLTRRPAPA